VVDDASVRKGRGVVVSTRTVAGPGIGPGEGMGMIRKTQSYLMRNVLTWRGKRPGVHNERILKETWWFLFVPIYSRETIDATNLQ
jgi:hypothetical protein